MQFGMHGEFHRFEGEMGGGTFHRESHSHVLDWASQNSQDIAWYRGRPNKLNPLAPGIRRGIAAFKHFVHISTETGALYTISGGQY